MKVPTIILISMVLLYLYQLQLKSKFSLYLKQLFLVIINNVFILFRAEEFDYREWNAVSNFEKYNVPTSGKNKL